MFRPADDEIASANPLVKERLGKRRSVFSPDRRIRMNVVPMFLNLVMIWGVFVFCNALTSFSMLYSQPTTVWVLIGIVAALWLVSMFVAVWSRIYDPDPSWWTYCALAVGVALISGTVLGHKTFESYTKPYEATKDLKVVRDVDASATPGTNLLDIGIVHFHPGNHFDSALSWHFKHGSLYCVAPIVSNVSSIPLRQTYDFWAVGKDCCSLGASDFRCGSWGSAGAKGGLRVVNEGDVSFYRLAVQQAASLYDVLAPSPVLVEWFADPEAELHSWAQLAMKSYLFQCGFAFVASLFGMAMFTARFSWIGRGESVYETEFYDNPGYNTAGSNTPRDPNVHSYSA